MTITRRNTDHLEDLVQLAVASQLDRFYISHLVPTGRARSMTVDALSGEQTREVLFRLFAMAEELVSQDSRLSVATGANDSDGVLLLYWLKARYGAAAAEKVEQLLRARRGNSAGEGVLCIDPRGRVHPDPFWRSVVVGDLCQQSLREVLDHPLLQSLRRRESLLEGRCGSCNWKELCRGSHRGRSEVATGCLWGSDPLCVLADQEVGVHSATVGRV
jgi:radical SAM protein with 4Fe4S-binding SPASM domain